MKKILIVVIGIFSGIALGLGVFGMTLLFSPDESRVSAPEEDIRLENIAPPPTLDENEPLFTLPPQTQPETEPETEPPAPTVQALPEKEPEKKPEKKPENRPSASDQVDGVSFRDAAATVYATAACNVRTGPNVHAASLGKLKKGEPIKQLAIGDNGWIRIQYEDRQAYAYGEYLSEKRPASQPPADESVNFEKVSQTVYSTGSVNVRSGPGKTYKAIGYLKEGYSAKRIGIGDNGWSKIIYEGKDGYVFSEYLTTEKPSDSETTEPSETQKPEASEPTRPEQTTPPETTVPETKPAETKPSQSEVTYETVNESVTATDSIHVRSGPGKNYKAIGYLQPGTSVRRVGIGSNGWSKILYENDIAYASSQYLKVSKPSSDPGKPPKPTPPKPAKPDKEEPDQPTYEKVAQMVYATDQVHVRRQPDIDADSLGTLNLGDSIQRVGIGSNGWSQVVYKETVAYVSSRFLSTEEIEIPDYGDTTTPGFPTPNSPFIYQYWEQDDVIPYAMFEPADSGDEPLPLIISLHGASEVGKGRQFLESRFLVKEFREWEYTGLKPINAYVVCPQLTGKYNAGTWNTPMAADLIFDLIESLKKDYDIDTNRIILEGHSMGAQGALYIAADSRASFSAVIVLDAYDPGVDLTNITSEVRGYTSDPLVHPQSKHYHDYMKELFNSTFQKENWFVVKSASHDSLPKAVFTMDKDHDKQSDTITWLLAQ